MNKIRSLAAVGALLCSASIVSAEDFEWTTARLSLTMPVAADFSLGDLSEDWDESYRVETEWIVHMKQNNPKITP